MRSRKLSLAAALVVAGLALSVFPFSATAQETILHNFTGGNDGKNPYCTLARDSSGNLYGTASSGGTQNSGVVFELTPAANGGWNETELHDFSQGDGSTDGYYPDAGVILDKSGNVYGTTYEGGAYNYGTVFELKPGIKGWTEKILHSFNNNGTDGQYPNAGLALDAAGHIYGTTSVGGAGTGGTVFELSQNTGGAWSEKILHSFMGNNSPGGTGPYYATLALDSSGNVYGVTEYGGAYGFGTLFELSPQAGGSWKQKVTHSFQIDVADGVYPEGGVIVDSSGNLYGTTTQAGSLGGGTVYEFSPTATGAWREQVLYAFSASNNVLGQQPVSSLTLDASGNLYGTTFLGGAYTFFGGTVFELSPASDGTWTETVLHSFGSGADGAEPWGGVVLDSQGNLYGTTISGGADSDGVVYEVTP